MPGYLKRMAISLHVQVPECTLSGVMRLVVQDDRQTCSSSDRERQTEEGSPNFHVLEWRTSQETSYTVR